MSQEMTVPFLVYRISNRCYFTLLLKLSSYELELELFVRIGNAHMQEGKAIDWFNLDLEIEQKRFPGES